MKAPARPELDELLREAVRLHSPSPADLRAQAISFVYGQLMDCAPHVTREEIARLYDDIAERPADPARCEACAHPTWCAEAGACYYGRADAAVAGDMPEVAPPSAVRLPEFITFTGIDDVTSVAGMADLASIYPIEWGLLLSPTRQGEDPRYPGGDAQSRFLWSGLRISAHLCGGHARAVMNGRRVDTPVDLGYCSRIQVNHVNPDAGRARELHKGWGPRCILQTRAPAFPTDTSIDWLFDASGGHGIAPSSWPPHPGAGRLVGYAGGIGPDNARAVIEEIGATGPYWIDMETGVRTHDRLDLKKCRRVCEAVYSRRTTLTPPRHCEERSDAAIQERRNGD